MLKDTAIIAQTSVRMCYNQRVMNIVVIIPAFEPDSLLVPLVNKLQGSFRAIIVVDDGSRHSDAVFATLPHAENIRFLRHPTNLGKGQALKTAFAEALRHYPNAIGAVTVDADGQHLDKDILTVSRALCASPDALILGVRTFQKGTPFRSRLGNLWTCCEFRLLTGLWVSDTQTGLRAIPFGLLNHLLTIPGDRYEYEIRMLVEIVTKRHDVIQVPITTVYHEGNSTSHFKPFVDTLKTQSALFCAVLQAMLTS